MHQFQWVLVTSNQHRYWITLSAKAWRDEKNYLVLFLHPLKFEHEMSPSSILTTRLLKGCLNKENGMDKHILKEKQAWKALHQKKNLGNYQQETHPLSCTIFFLFIFFFLQPFLLTLVLQVENLLIIFFVPYKKKYPLLLTHFFQAGL